MCRSLTYLSLLASLSLLACASQQQTKAPGTETQAKSSNDGSSASQSSDAAPADDEVSDDEAALLAQIEADAQIADEQAAGDEGDDKREVIYRLTPDGLRIEVQGAQFSPRVESVKLPGGYGVKLTILASTEAPVVLYSPQNGPLAFGGVVQRSDKEKFGDKREGGIEVQLSPGAPVSFNRSWPGPDQAPLKPGEKLELHVGLWGLGTSSDDRRPVNRFLVVKMVADQKGATPTIEPPPR